MLNFLRNPFFTHTLFYFGKNKDKAFKTWVLIAPAIILVVGYVLFVLG